MTPFQEFISMHKDFGDFMRQMKDWTLGRWIAVILWSWLLIPIISIVYGTLFLTFTIIQAADTLLYAIFGSWTTTEK